VLLLARPPFGEKHRSSCQVVDDGRDGHRLLVLVYGGIAVLAYPQGVAGVIPERRLDRVAVDAIIAIVEQPLDPVEAKRAVGDVPAAHVLDPARVRDVVVGVAEETAFGKSEPDLA